MLLCILQCKSLANINLHFIFFTTFFSKVNRWCMWLTMAKNYKIKTSITDLLITKTNINTPVETTSTTTTTTSTTSTKVISPQTAIAIAQSEKRVRDAKAMKKDPNLVDKIVEKTVEKEVEKGIENSMENKEIGNDIEIDSIDLELLVQQELEVQMIKEKKEKEERELVLMFDRDQK